MQFFDFENYLFNHLPQLIKEEFKENMLKNEDYLKYYVSHNHSINYLNYQLRTLEQ